MKKLFYIFIGVILVLVFSGVVTAADTENIPSMESTFSESDSVINITVGPSDSFTSSENTETSLNKNIPIVVTDVDPQLLWESNQYILDVLNDENNSNTGVEPAILGSSADDAAWAGSEWTRPKLPSKGTVKIGIIFLEFPDYPFTNYPYTPGDMNQDVYNKFFGTGDSAEYPYESLRNFYTRSSYGQLSITGNVIGYARWSENRGDVSMEDMENMIDRIVTRADEAGVDFSQYDNDNDGWIDGLYILWTGPETRGGTPWITCQQLFPDSVVEADGRKLRGFVWAPIGWNNNGPNIFQPRGVIHETGHMLGLPDLYDYDGSVGPRGALGGMDIMDSNGDHNCFSKFLLGWIQPTLIYGTHGDYQYKISLSPSDILGDAVLIMPDYDSIFGEYFMVQYRRPAGNDKYLPNDGLVIWHVDATMNSDYTHFQYNNQVSDHKLIRLMEADGLEEIEQGLGANAGDFYVPSTRFGPDTWPNSDSYYPNYSGTSNKVTNVNVYDIVNTGYEITARFGFNKPISLPEALDTPGLSWNTGGLKLWAGQMVPTDAEWYGQNFVSKDGSDSAQSSVVDDNNLVWLETSITGPGYLSFDWKVSSEENHDLLKFYVDNILIDQISGLTNWQSVTYRLKVGQHKIRWAYEKDGIDQFGRVDSDCGWLDQVKFVYHNDPPLANAGGPYTGTPDAALTLDASKSSDPDGSSLLYAWDFNNDGTWDTPYSTTPQVTYTWANNYRGLIKVIVTDGEFISTNTASVDISNPPQAALNGPYVGEEGKTIIFDAKASTDPDGDLISYRWDVDNDGAWDTGWSIIVIRGHIYPDDWTGKVTVEVTDGVTTSSATTNVNIINVPPQVEVGTNQNMFTDEQITFTGSFTDPGTLDTHMISWDFGDGSNLITGTLTPSHTYALPGVYTVKLTVTDDDGGVGTDSLTVTVSQKNFAPVAVAGGPYIGTEGTPITVDASGSFDQDGDALQYRWDYDNDGTWDTTYSKNPQAAYTWPDEYTGTVKLEVTDSKEISTATTTVEVNNVAPQVEAGPNLEVITGTTVSFTGNLIDPGTLDTHTFSWDFGDGSAPVTGTLTPTHTFKKAGTYTVTLKVTDDDGGVGTDTLTVSVKPIPVTVDIKPGETPNSINVNSNGLIPVAILTTSSFDASTVDPSSVTFGHSGVERSLAKWLWTDVDKDGDKDLLLYFYTKKTGLILSDKELVLKGLTTTGLAIESRDTIKTVPK